MTERESASLEEQIKAAVELTVELFNKVKEDTHYASPHLRLSTFMNCVMFYATNEMLQTETFAALYGSWSKPKDSANTMVSCASFGHQTRETNLNLCRSLFDYWKSAYCQGEWGNTNGVTGALSNPGIPEIDTPRYFVAGEDLQEGDPAELLEGKVYVHRDMKK